MKIRSVALLELKISISLMITNQEDNINQCACGNPLFDGAYPQCNKCAAEEEKEQYYQNLIGGLRSIQTISEFINEFAGCIPEYRRWELLPIEKKHRISFLRRRSEYSSDDLRSSVINTFTFIIILNEYIPLEYVDQYESLKLSYRMAHKDYL